MTAVCRMLARKTEMRDGDMTQMGHFDNIDTNLFPAFLLFLKCPLGK